MVYEAAKLADATGQLDILGYDGPPLGVGGTDVGDLEQPHAIGLAGLLESLHSRVWEAKHLLLPPDLPEQLWYQAASSELSSLTERCYLKINSYQQLQSNQLRKLRK